MDLLACSGGGGLRSRGWKSKELSAVTKLPKRILSNPCFVSAVGPTMMKNNILG
jgi:hypothetical protein